MKQFLCVKVKAAVGWWAASERGATVHVAQQPSAHLFCWAVSMPRQMRGHSSERVPCPVQLLPSHDAKKEEKWLCRETAVACLFGQAETDRGSSQAEMLGEKRHKTNWVSSDTLDALDLVLKLTF